MDAAAVASRVVFTAFPRIVREAGVARSEKCQL